MKEDLNDHIDDLIGIVDSIPQKQISILVGSNGSGKSLIRKVLPNRVGETSQTSMEQRTSSNPEWGALSSSMQDTAWCPTSSETLRKIDALFVEEFFTSRFIVLDEPEIGMGEETVMAVCDLLNEKLKEASKLEDFKGVLIITHNRYFVENLFSQNFFSTDSPNMTKEEWLNREITPIDLNSLRENPLFKAVRDRLKTSKND